VHLLEVLCFTIGNIELLVIAWMAWCITGPQRDDEPDSCYKRGSR
jgi:hypothetical protein